MRSSPPHELRGRIGCLNFELFRQQSSWLPQGLAAASVPEHFISDGLLPLTAALLYLNPQATAIFPLGKMDSHGLAHILAVHWGLEGIHGFCPCLPKPAVMRFSPHECDDWTR